MRILQYRFAKRLSRAPKSFLDELFHVSADPSIISFAGGFPSTALIDTEGIARATNSVLEGDASAALQYTTTDGYLPLREYIAECYHHPRRDGLISFLLRFIFNNLPGIHNTDESGTRIFLQHTMTAPAGKAVRLETNMGTIVIALAPDMPITGGNFETLVQKGYYNGVLFHRVIDGFMIQGGDPTGTGCGGPGYAIKDEFSPGNRNDRGTISMANAGPNTGGSQFFINLVNNNFLDGKHPVFGRVVEGMGVVDKIAKSKTGPGDRPVKEVIIVKAGIT